MRPGAGVLVLLLTLACRGEEKPTPAAVAPVCDGASVLRIAVQPGDFVHAVAGQEARDVALTLFGPEGRPLLLVDGLSTPSAPPFPAEEIHWVAEAPGEIRIELTLLSGHGGPCDLRLATRRRATAADRRRAEAEAELARGHALRRTREPGRCRTGIAPYERAQGRFADLGLPRRRAEALLGLGLLHKECLRENRAALAALTRTEPLFSGDPAFESVVRQNLGELQAALGDLDGAIGEYRRALELRRQLGERAYEALTSNSLGFALHLRGHYDDAASSFDRAIALWREGDDPGERAGTLLNRGHLHLDLGEADQARERFNAALALFRQAKDRHGEAVTLNALGLLDLDAGRPGAALEPLRGALALRLPGSRGRAVTLTSLGVAFRQLDQLADARRAYAEALPIFRGVGDLREEARTLANLGWLEASLAHDTAALGHFDRALGLFRTLADPPELARALEGKAWVLRRRGDLAAARGLMEEALAAVERHRFRQTSYTTRAEFFATRQDSYGFLIDLLMEMHRKAPGAGYAAAALEVSERSLARSLLDGLAAGGARFHRGGAAPDLHAREREIEREIEVLVSRQNRLSQDAAPPEQLRPVEEALGRRWQELDRVRAGLRAGDPRYAALTQPWPWSATEIQRELLDSETLLLEYRLGEKRSHLWAVTPDTLESFELPGRAEIERVAGQAGGLLARSRSRQAELSADVQLARLSRLLLDPVAPLLAGKRLIVVGDGMLQNLPFAALPEPGVDPEAGPGAREPLIARHEIVALPSVSVLGELRRQVAGRPPAPKALWVLADPDFGGRFARLTFSAEEAAAILALAPASQHFAVLGREARRAAVLNGALQDYRFLHFATHGSFATTDPGGGRLVLAQTGPRGQPEANGFLHLADIYELDLRADLVVLSACQSALGREVRGEGMMGMTRGFFYAGAERMVVSLWNVDDRAAVELMRLLYRGILKEGLSPAAALRAAQNTIRQQPHRRSPYYWAGFTLQGEWRGEGGRARTGTD